jgi:hypothetical protein
MSHDATVTTGTWTCLLPGCPLEGTPQPAAPGRTPGVTYGEHYRAQHQADHRRDRPRDVARRYWPTEAGLAALDAP